MLAFDPFFDSMASLRDEKGKTSIAWGTRSPFGKILSLGHVVRIVALLYIIRHKLPIPFPFDHADSRRPQHVLHGNGFILGAWQLTSIGAAIVTGFFIDMRPSEAFSLFAVFLQ
jgi:hypothetical protein